MGVDVDAMLTYGWRMERDEVPDFDEHWENEWEDVFGVEFHGLHPCELVDIESSYDDESDVYVGWPLPANCSLPEFNGRLVEAGMHVEEIWRLVMGRELAQDDPAPKLLLYARWW